MPTVPEYLALAEAMHDESDDCQANYVMPFAECPMREIDIQDAVRVGVALRKEGWRLIRDISTTELGL
jgi:hypothetical protein